MGFRRDIKLIWWYENKKRKSLSPMQSWQWMMIVHWDIAVCMVNEQKSIGFHSVTDSPHSYFWLSSQALFTKGYVRVLSVFAYRVTLHTCQTWCCFHTVIETLYFCYLYLHKFALPGGKMFSTVITAGSAKEQWGPPHPHHQEFFSFQLYAVAALFCQDIIHVMTVPRLIIT